MKSKPKIYTAKLKDKDWKKEMVKLILNYQDTLKLSQFMVVFVDDLISSERKKAVIECEKACRLNYDRGVEVGKKRVLKELEGKIEGIKVSGHYNDSEEYKAGVEQMREFILDLIRQQI